MDNVFDAIRDAFALGLTAVAWVSTLSVQDFISWLMATCLTLASIIYVLYGIRTRYTENKIRQKELEELNNNETT